MAIENFNPLSSFLSIATCLPLFSTWPLVWLVWGTDVFVVCCWQCEVVDDGGAILAKSCGGWFEFDKKNGEIGQLEGRKGLTLLCYGLLVWWVLLGMEKRMKARERILAFWKRKRVDVSWKEEWQLDLSVR